MRWRELDLVERLWRIPAARTKNHDTHVVPLSAGALSVIETLGPGDGKAEWLLPSPTGAGPIWAAQKAAERIRQRSGVREMRMALESWAALLAGVVSGEARRAAVLPLLRR